MRIQSTLIASIGIVLAISTPALAANSMMMKKGEVVAVMPNGQMARMMPSGKMMISDDMKKAARPMDSCVMMMMGDDGKMYMMDDMAMANGKMACESMMSAKKK